MSRGRRIYFRLIVAAFAATAGLGFAAAQDDVEENLGGGEEVEGSLEVERGVQLSGAEQIAEAEKVLVRGTRVSRRVATMLDESRRESDIIRVTCLDDKLTQTNANLRSAEDRTESLREAVQANNTDLRNHEFTVITVLGQKFSTLEQEANQCLGQDVYLTGPTKIVTVIDPDSPTEDPTEIPSVPPGVDVPYIPPPASGTM